MNCGSHVVNCCLITHYWYTWTKRTTLSQMNMTCVESYIGTCMMMNHIQFCTYILLHITGSHWSIVPSPSRVAEQSDYTYRYFLLKIVATGNVSLYCFDIQTGQWTSIYHLVKQLYPSLCSCVRFQSCTVVDVIEHDTAILKSAIKCMCRLSRVGSKWRGGGGERKVEVTVGG